MTCKQVHEKLIECWGSTEELASEALVHVESCPECEHEALLLRQTQTLVHAVPQERAPDGLTDQIMAQLAREESRQPWRERLADWVLGGRQPVWARAAAIGAALALAVAGGGYWYGLGQQAAQQEQIAASAQGAEVQMAEDLAATEAELDELMIKHQMIEVTQPLAEDIGVGLVVYTSQ